jgi:hypothetical protein
MQGSMNTYKMKDIVEKAEPSVKQPALNQAMDSGSAGSACGLGNGGLPDGPIVKQGGPKRG